MGSNLLLLITTFLFANAVVNACVCMKMETCELPTYSSEVFIGKVLNSQQEERKVDLFGSGRLETATFQVSRVAVSKVINGTVRDKEILIETDNFTSCHFSLRKNVEYFIYANKLESSGRYGTGSCSGTKPISEASDDLKYLSEKDSRVEGGASYWAKKIKNGDELPENPIILTRLGITTIFLENEKYSLESNIGQDGKYSFKNVPPGEYRFRIPLPSGYEIYEYWPFDPPKDKDLIRVTGLGCKVGNTSIIKS